MCHALHQFPPRIASRTNKTDKNCLFASGRVCLGMGVGWFLNCWKVRAFSAVMKPIFGSKSLFCSFSRDVHDWDAFAPLHTQKFAVSHHLTNLWLNFRILQDSSKFHQLLTSVIFGWYFYEICWNWRYCGNYEIFAGSQLFYRLRNISRKIEAFCRNPIEKGLVGWFREKWPPFPLESLMPRINSSESWCWQAGSVLVQAVCDMFQRQCACFGLQNERLSPRTSFSWHMEMSRRCFYQES